MMLTYYKEEINKNVNNCHIFYFFAEIKKYTVCIMKIKMIQHL